MTGAGPWFVVAGLLSTAPAVAAALPTPTPQRICSVSLAGDEWLQLLGVTARVVCVSTFADDPQLSNVAGRHAPSAARLVARVDPVVGRVPDLVLAAPWNDGEFLRALQRSGIPSLVLADVSSFDAIETEARRLGSRLGVEPAATAVIDAMRARLAAIDRALAGVASRPRVLAVSHLVVAGRETSVDALIRRAGGLNAAAEAGLRGHTQVTVERLLSLDPDVLLLGLDESPSRDSLLAQYPQLRLLRAVRENRVVIMPPRLLTTVTPYLAEGAETLARALHPDAAW